VIAGNCRPTEPGETPKVEYVGIYGGAGRADLLLAAIKPEYTEAGNVAKLSGAGDRRHLFIRVDHTSGDAYVALRHAELPDSLPDLPDVITDIWLWADDLRAFHFTRQSGWAEHPIPKDVLTEPGQLRRQ
jgi:hypothetical protein